MIEPCNNKFQSDVNSYNTPKLSERDSVHFLGRLSDF